MQPLRPLAALSAGLVFTTAAAQADDPATILAKIRAAAAAVTSFTLLVQEPDAPGVGGSITVVLPASVKSAFTIGPMSIASYAVDGMVYVHVPDGGWQKMKIDPGDVPAQFLKIFDSLQSPKMTLLPDRKRKHTLVGVFQTEALLPQAAAPGAPAVPQTIVCTYDKISFLTQTCTAPNVALTFTKYNDPSNAFVLPDEAKNAVLVIQHPAPAASAAPDLPDPARSAPPTPAPSGGTRCTHFALR